ncbi:MAG: histidine kinase [Tannerella sp.]|jgi:sensor histidine kinase YesM|nr:histidine kinase [Tannerella sp.]
MDKTIATDLKQKNKGFPRRFGWLIHGFAGLLLFLSPFFFRGSGSESVDLSDYLRFALTATGIIIVFYVNYYGLVKRFLFTRQIWQYIASNLVLFTVIIVGTFFLMELIPPPADVRPRRLKHESFFVWILVFDFIKYIFITAMSVAFKMTASWYKAETERKELEKMRTEAELQNLKSQLNPHFLFNTLNNIYSLIAISSERAQAAVHELSRLLRYILYDSSHPFVTAGKDLAFVRNYIELMRIRLPEHAELKTDIHIYSPDTLIAPLLFISLIENAFKHGISNNKPSFIELVITAESGRISCIIRNSFFPKDEQDKSGSGIGIANLQKRLELLYPQKHELTCQRKGEIFISELVIDLY